MKNKRRFIVYFKEILLAYKQNSFTLAKLQIEHDVLEKELHFLIYPFRRDKMPSDVKENSIILQNKIYDYDDKINKIAKVVRVQKEELKSLSEDNR